MAVQERFFLDAKKHRLVRGDVRISFKGAGLMWKAVTFLYKRRGQRVSTASIALKLYKDCEQHKRAGRVMVAIRRKVIKELEKSLPGPYAIEEYENLFNPGVGFQLDCDGPDVATLEPLVVKSVTRKGAKPIPAPAVSAGLDQVSLELGVANVSAPGGYLKIDADRAGNAAGFAAMMLAISTDPLGRRVVRDVVLPLLRDSLAKTNEEKMSG